MAAADDAPTPTNRTDVRIGDASYPIGRLTAFKVIRIGGELTELMNAVPELATRVSAYTAEYREHNVLRLSRAAAELRYDAEELARISDEAWAQSDGQLVLPASPSGVEIAGQVFPYVFNEAYDRVLRILTLLITPNSELKEADDNGSIDSVLDGKKRVLLHADASEVLDVLVVAGEVIEQQFSGQMGKIRAALASFGIAQAMTESDSTPQTPKPESSTDSPPDTGGPEDGFSTQTPTPISVGS